MRTAEKRLMLRKKRIRKKVIGTNECPRLNIYKSNKHIYAQLVDDENGNTLVFTSTLSKELKGKVKSTDSVTAAQSVGDLIAKKAIEKGLKKVVFDRSGYLYHGRIKAFAEAARKSGLEF
ncbi:MAG: 50S ribosomal protein L18 [Endomicrobiales bacterium]|nr:50S ribosomal protein L18 [Endomicrobiales bacterium]